MEGFGKQGPCYDETSCITTPEYSVGSFSASGTPARPLQPGFFRTLHHFPSRRVVRPLPEYYDVNLEAWAVDAGLKKALGPLIPSLEDRLRVLQLLYQYRHLNGEDLTNLPCTNIITHRVRITEGTKPYAARGQRWWPMHTEW